jgi:hypothetical protein
MIQVRTLLLPSLVITDPEDLYLSKECIVFMKDVELGKLYLIKDQSIHIRSDGVVGVSN